MVTEADFSDDLQGPVSRPLRDPRYFRQARFDEEAWTVVWPNGFDPDPYVLHGDHAAAPPSGSRVRRLQPASRPPARSSGQARVSKRARAAG
jgi:Protein of unknown function (DUF2442)